MVLKDGYAATFGGIPRAWPRGGFPTSVWIFCVFRRRTVPYVRIRPSSLCRNHKIGAGCNPPKRASLITKQTHRSQLRKHMCSKRPQRAPPRSRTPRRPTSTFPCHSPVWCVVNGEWCHNQPKNNLQLSSHTSSLLNIKVTP